MINELKIKNFKCFEKLNIELSNLNVFAGINSMGKSSTIQSLLLLRQSFEMGALDKGLHLNGNLVQIGNGSELLYRNSNDEEIGISLTVGDKSLEWTYNYNKDSDFQRLKSSNFSSERIENTNLFKSTFSYVSAERIGPQRFYKTSYYDIFELNQVGIRGELFADYLAERGKKDKVENSAVIHSKQTSDLLINQTQQWLSEISPGIRIDATKHSNEGIVGIEYKVFNSDFSPMNVGFGLSYVIPIIVCLLKAKEDDLIIIENPEAHLHPRGQRRMGELIAKAASGGVQIILETHSDHILNGIRLAVKNKEIRKDKVKLNYFYQEIIKDAKMGESVIHRKCSPVITDDGRLSDWPDGFFDEWDKALDELF